MQTLSGGEVANDRRLDNMPLQLARTENGAILYDPSRIDHPNASDFDADAIARDGRLRAPAGGRGSAWFVTARAPATGEWVLRHYRRGGFVARFVEDTYFWPGATRVRSFRELELLAALAARGLPVAPPVAARYVRSGLVYRADLITQAIPGVRTLTAVVNAGPGEPALTPAGWRAIGACVRRFHDAGADHADLNAHNVLLDASRLATDALAPDGGVHLVDFDRGVLREPGGTPAWREANLERLERSLRKVTRESPGRFGAPQWSAFRAGYDAR